MRTIVNKLLVDNMPETLLRPPLGEDPVSVPDHVWPAGSILGENVPPRPFIVVRYGVVNRGMGNVDQGSVDFWVHDEQGDYARIDDIQDAIRGIMDGVTHVSEEGGSAELIQAEFQTKSGDLYDPGFRTITRSSTYRLTGTGA